MPTALNDAWLVRNGERLIVVPDNGEAWLSGYDSATFSCDCTTYRHPQYASEWIALTTEQNTDVVAGVLFDLVMHSDLARWLNEGFINVRRIRQDAFQIHLAESTALVEQQWPLLPCDALRADDGDYALWLPSYYKSLTHRVV